MSSTRKRALHEGAHKLGSDGDGDADVAKDAPRGVRHNFNEAAHKLGYWPVSPAPRPTPPPPGPPRAPPATTSTKPPTNSGTGRSPPPRGRPPTSRRT